MGGPYHATGLFRASILTMAIVLVSACSAGNPEERAEKFYQSAEKSYAAQDYSASVIQLKNSLQESNSYLPSRLFLGRVYLETYRLAAAEKELVRARDLGAGPEDYLPYLMRTYNLSGQFAKTLGLMETAPQSLRSRSDVRGYHADALTGQGRYKDAKSLLQADPEQSSTILTRLGQIAWLENDMDMVRIYAHRALEKGPDLAESNILMGRLYLADQDYDNARRVFKKALEADPLSPPAALSYASVLVEQQDTDEAVTVLDQMRKNGHEGTQALYLRALIALQKQDFAGAKLESERVLSMDPGNRAAMLVAGVANSALGNDEAAINNLRRFSSEAGAPAVAGRALAWSNLRLDRADEALSAIEGALSRTGPDFGSLRLATAAAVRAGQFEKAEGFLREMVKQEPDDISLSIGLASLSLAAGNKEEAERILAALPQDAGQETLEERVRLALVYMGAENYQQATNFATDLRRDFPDREEGYSLAGLALAAQHQFDEAIGYFEQALAIDPGAMNAASALVSIYREQNRRDDALRVLKKAHETDLDNRPLTLALAQMQMEQGQFADSEKLLLKLASDAPEAMEPRLLLARVYLNTGEREKALNAAQRAHVLAPDNDAVLETLGLAYRSSGDFKNAVSSFERLVQVRPENSEAHFLLGRSLAEIGQIDEAISAIRDTLKRDSEKLLAQAALIRLLSVRGDLEDAKSELVRLKAMAPVSADLYDLEGFLNFRAGDMVKAAAQYRLAYEMDQSPRRAIVLAQAMWLAGDEVSAEALLKSLDTDGANIQLAQLYIQHGRTVDALAVYRALVRKEPDNPIFLNDFAWTLWENGQVDEAYKHAKKAVTLAPRSAAIQDTYGMILVDRGDTEAAVAALQLAVEQGAGNPEFQLHLAMALLADKQAELAQPLLRALAGHEGFNRRSEAQELLELHFK